VGADLTYSEVGATAGTLPRGYHHVCEAVVIGHGQDDLDNATTTLMTWEMHRRCGIRVLSAPPSAEVGGEVTMRWCGQRFHCRVVDVVDEPLRRGFAYGTLPRHPERGEERFLVSIDEETGDVTASITAFSRPGSWTTRLAGPIGRRIQHWMTRRYLEPLRPL
jgi:uncharacterized protein (UPF0548 family)